MPEPLEVEVALGAVSLDVTSEGKVQDYCQDEGEKGECKVNHRKMIKRITP